MQKRTCSEMKFPKLDYSLQATNIENIVQIIQPQERRVKHFSTFNLKCKNSQLLTENSKNGISQTIPQINFEQKHLIESNNKIIKCVDRRIQLEQMTTRYLPDQIIYTQYFYGKIKEILQMEKNNKQIYEACVQVLHQIHALVTQHQSESIIKVKQLKFNNSDKKYTIALDLDETLIHSEEYQFNKQYDFTNYKFGAYFRPFYYQFLERLALYADIFIYTTAKKNYAKIIIDAIDPQRKYIKRVLALEDCLYSKTGKFLIKDISIINNDLTKTFLIDNNPQSFTAQPQNGIPIVPFYDNKNDKELMILLAFIEKEIFTSENVQLVIRRFFQFEQFRQFENGMQAYSALYD